MFSCPFTPKFVFPVCVYDALSFCLPYTIMSIFYVYVLPAFVSMMHCHFAYLIQ